MANYQSGVPWYEAGLGNGQNDKLFVNWQIICPFTNLTICKRTNLCAKNIFFIKFTCNI